MTNESDGFILLIANRTCPCPDVLDEVCRRAQERNGGIVIVAPALNSRLRHYVSDTDGAVAAAKERLASAVEGLEALGVEAVAEVGDADPLQAIEDTVRRFAPLEILISTYPEGRSNWLERKIVARARERFDVPVSHIVSRYGLMAVD